MATLNSHVWVDGKLYGPGDDDIPEDVAAQIGVHAWEDGEHPYPEALAKADAKREAAAVRVGIPVNLVPAAATTQSEPEPDRQPGTEPPRAGRGSSRDAWAAFLAEVRAKGTTVEVADDAKQGEIIAALVAAGVIEA